jgi:hypothetical protein
VRINEEDKKVKVQHPKGMFFYAQIALKRRFLVLKRAFFAKIKKRLISSCESDIFPRLKMPCRTG